MKGVKTYPFNGKMLTVTEIWRYYQKKEIDIQKSTLVIELNEKTKGLAKEEIREEDVISAVKGAIAKRSIAAAVGNFGENCINEFGQEFWKEIITKKQENRNKRFRDSMKEGHSTKSVQKLSVIESEQKSKSMTSKSSDERV